VRGPLGFFTTASPPRQSGQPEDDKRKSDDSDRDTDPGEEEEEDEPDDDERDGESDHVRSVPRVRRRKQERSAPAGTQPGDVRALNLMVRVGGIEFPQ